MATDVGLVCFAYFGNQIRHFKLRTFHKPFDLFFLKLPGVRFAQVSFRKYFNQLVVSYRPYNRSIIGIMIIVCRLYRYVAEAIKCGVPYYSQFVLECVVYNMNLAYRETALQGHHSSSRPVTPTLIRLAAP